MSWLLIAPRFNNLLGNIVIAKQLSTSIWLSQSVPLPVVDYT